MPFFSICTYIASYTYTVSFRPFRRPTCYLSLSSCPSTTIMDHAASHVCLSRSLSLFASHNPPSHHASEPLIPFTRRAHTLRAPPPYPQLALPRTSFKRPMIDATCKCPHGRIISVHMYIRTPKNSGEPAPSADRPHCLFRRILQTPPAGSDPTSRLPFRICHGAPHHSISI